MMFALFSSLHYSSTPFSSASFFSVLAMTTRGSAFRGSRRGLFRMQIGWTALWDIFFDPFLEGRAARQWAGHDVDRERLCFHDGDVGLAGNRHEIVRRTPFHRA